MVRSTLARGSGAGEIVSEERRWSWVVVLLIATLMVTSVRGSLASPSVGAPSPNSFPNASALASDLGLLSARSAPAPATSPDASACNYTATFNETGLPLGATWDMTSNGATVSATVTTTGGTSVTFSGVCYATVTPFAVSSPPGYAANPSSGYFLSLIHI